jgi:hypothetical protein
MHLHHQGMYIATRELLRAWRERKGCNFDQIKNRPGSGSQPSEGTQRVWMSSQQLFAVSNTSFHTLFLELLHYISCRLSR